MSEAITNFETLCKALSLFDGFDGPSNEHVWWRTDDDYAPITLLVNCNDFFMWGCSDCETLAANDIPALERALDDCEAVGERHEGHFLWIARKRGLRPQGAMYKYLGKPTWPLFDACGPERKPGLGDPEARPTETVQ